MKYLVIDTDGHTYTHTHHLRNQGRKLITRIVEVERQCRGGGGAPKVYVL